MIMCNSCTIPHYPRSLQLGVCQGYAGDYTRTAAPVSWDLYFPKVQSPPSPTSARVCGSGALH